MVLVLVGNIKAQQISGRINAAFGRLAAKPAPERKVYQNLEIKGPQTIFGPKWDS